MMKFKKPAGMVAVMVVFFVWLALMLSGTIWAGSLEPSAPPGPTMKTLDQIPPTWSQTLPASDRFELVLRGEGILDKETGLVWERQPNNLTVQWLTASNGCFQTATGGRKGWRLPSVEELASLVDPSAVAPPFLPSGHPFGNVQAFTQFQAYWTATTKVNNTDEAYLVSFFNGEVQIGLKASSYNAWCVRGGHGFQDQ